jgi:hypothetical protein
LDDAQANFEQALAIYRTVFGNECPDTADTLIWLANISKSKGDSIKASEYGKEALKIHEVISGMGGEDTKQLSAVYG